VTAGVKPVQSSIVRSCAYISTRPGAVAKLPYLTGGGETPSSYNDASLPG